MNIISRKPFSEKLHQQYDEFGRKNARELSLQNDKFLANTAGKYDIDFLVYDVTTGDHVGYADVEVRPDIFVNGYPKYKTFHCIERKILLYSQLDKPSYYLIVSGDGNVMYVASIKTILENGNIIQINTKYVKDEHYFDISTDFFKRIERNQHG